MVEKDWRKVFGPLNLDLAIDIAFEKYHKEKHSGSKTSDARLESLLTQNQEMLKHLLQAQKWFLKLYSESRLNPPSSGRRYYKNSVDRAVEVIEWMVQNINETFELELLEADKKRNKWVLLQLQKRLWTVYKKYHRQGFRLNKSSLSKHISSEIEARLDIKISSKTVTRNIERYGSIPEDSV